MLDFKASIWIIVETRPRCILIHATLRKCVLKYIIVWTDSLTK